MDWPQVFVQERYISVVALATVLGCRILADEMSIIA
jgi:hypothetical protein